MIHLLIFSLAAPLVSQQATYANEETCVAAIHQLPADRYGICVEVKS